MSLIDEVGAYFVIVGAYPLINLRAIWSGFLLPNRRKIQFINHSQSPALRINRTHLASSDAKCEAMSQPHRFDVKLISERVDLDLTIVPQIVALGGGRTRHRPGRPQLAWAPPRQTILQYGKPKQGLWHFANAK